MTSWNFGKSPGNSELILMLYYLLDSVYKIFPVRPPYIKEFVKKIIMAVCLKFDQQACRKQGRHVSDVMGQFKSDILLHFQLTGWFKALSHVDTKYKCGFESHYQLNNFNVSFLLNLTVKFNITKDNYYFDILTIIS